MTMLSLAGNILNWIAAGVLFPLMLLPLAALLEHFRAKWESVRVKEMRPNNNLKPVRDSVKIGTALAHSKYSALIWFSTVAAVVLAGVLFATLAPILSVTPSMTQAGIFIVIVIIISALIFTSGGAGPLIARLSPIIEKLVSASAQAVMWLLLAMALIQFGIVVLRYVFGINYIFMQESITYMHGAVFLLAAGYALLTDDHVRVDIFYREAPAKRKALIDLLGTYLLLFPVCLLLLWTASPYVANSWAVGESSAEASGIAGVFILKSFIPAFAVLLAMAGFNIAARAGDVLRGRS